MDIENTSSLPSAETARLEAQSVFVKGLDRYAKTDDQEVKVVLGGVAYAAVEVLEAKTRRIEDNLFSQGLSAEDASQKAQEMLTQEPFYQTYSTLISRAESGGWFTAYQDYQVDFQRIQKEADVRKEKEEAKREMALLEREKANLESEINAAEALATSNGEVKDILGLQAQLRDIKAKIKELFDIANDSFFTPRLHANLI